MGRVGDEFDGAVVLGGFSARAGARWIQLDTMEGMTPPVASLGIQLNTELVQIDLTPRNPSAKPAWLKAKAPMGETFHSLKKMARELNLHTVCESAQRPNIGEGWNQKRASVMMLGSVSPRVGEYFGCRAGRTET